MNNGRYSGNVAETQSSVTDKGDVPKVFFVLFDTTCRGLGLGMGIGNFLEK